MVNYITALFKISLYAMLLPPFTISIATLSVNINIIGRLFLLAASLLMVISYTKKGGLKFSKSEMISYYLAFIFVILNSLSFFNIINTITFLKAYEKFSMGFLVYSVSFYLYKLDNKTHIKNVIFTFAIIMFVRLFMEFFLYLFPDIFLSVFESFIKTETLVSFQANLMRQRTYIDLTAESFIPIGIYFLIVYKKFLTKVIGLILIIGQVSISFLSNWRGRIINAVFVLAIAALTISKSSTNKLRGFALVILTLMPLFLVFDRYQLANSGFSVLDRLANKSEIEDEQTIEWRIDAMKEAFAMANSNIIGVGLGNFYEHTTLKPKGESLLTRDARALAEAAATSGPHNIFFQYLGESGYIAVVFFIFYLIFLLRQDIAIIFSKKRAPEYLVLCLSFWGLILGTMFYPATSLSFYISFFTLRSVLQNT